MISDAMLTQEYFDTMNSLDGDLAGKRSARAYMDQSSAIVHHRVVGASFIPRLYNDEVWERFRFISETIHTILCKVIERYRSDGSYRTKTIPPAADLEWLVEQGFATSVEEVEREGVLYNNISGLYLYNGTFTGVFSRLGPLPEISKEHHGMTAATIRVRDRA